MKAVSWKIHEDSKSAWGFRENSIKFKIYEYFPWIHRNEFAPAKPHNFFAIQLKGIKAAREQQFIHFNLMKLNDGKKHEESMDLLHSPNPTRLRTFNRYWFLVFVYKCATESTLPSMDGPRRRMMMNCLTITARIFHRHFFLLRLLFIPFFRREAIMTFAAQISTPNPTPWMMKRNEDGKKGSRAMGIFSLTAPDYTLEI